MKFLVLALLSFYPFLQVKSSTPKSVTCTRTEYREEYIPGTKSSPGYVRNYEVDVEIPCGGNNAAKIKDDCTDGKIAGALLGGGIGGAVSRKEGRWWAVPLGAVTGAAIGCQVDGGELISWIKGELVSSWQANNKFFILINCQGLGYEIQTLESVIVDINTKKNFEKEIILWLKHIKKEDSDTLFGFNNKEQRDFFIQILNIKGIGSQIGMTLLNKFTLNEIINAIVNNDKKMISSVQGIGQKMTERIILELKSKVINNQIEKETLDKNNFLLENIELNSIFKDIDLTLQSLNYSKKEIKNLYPLLINDIKNNKNLILEKNSFSFETILKVAMNYLDKQ